MLDLQRILRVPETCAITGDKRSSLYDKAKRGLFVKPIKIGPRASGFPSDEVAAINRARIAGKSEAEIRELVKLLEARRKIHSQEAAT